MRELRGKRVVVTGGRTYATQPMYPNDEQAAKYEKEASDLERALDALQPSEMGEGGAKGMDAASREWALTNIRKIPCRQYEANWALHGKLAGHIRNGHMLDQFKPDYVLAGPGGAGTANCVASAKQRGIPVVTIEQVLVWARVDERREEEREAHQTARR